MIYSWFIFIGSIWTNNKKKKRADDILQKKKIDIILFLYCDAGARRARGVIFFRYSLDIIE